VQRSVRFDPAMPAAASTQDPTLFLLVDAIPYDVAREVWEAGSLPGFGEPRPSVSCFPSLTDVALGALLRDIFPARPPGYEARYYHPPSGEVRGPGDPVSEAAVEPLHGRPRGLAGHAVVYLLRGPLAEVQARWITHRFRREGGPWLAYVPATDGVGHFSGRDGLVRVFADIGRVVAGAREAFAREHGVLPGAVLCSDHGMAFGRLDHLAARTLARHLEAAGFDPASRGPDRAVLVPYGDVGAGAVHVEPGRAAEAARVVAALPGVDLVFAREPEGGGCLVLGHEGASRARIRWRDERFRYEPEAGDPLDYTRVFEALEREGQLRDGFAADAELFTATWRHRYPDALARVRLALEDLVLHPAPVLFSMQDTWSYGPALTHLGARVLGGLLGTHGALSAAQSVGFAAATAEAGDPWPGAPALRATQVFRPWKELVRAGAAGSR
jgi:hypothetical protein